MKRLVLITLFAFPFVGFSQTQADTLRLIEEKYGEQWDFCTCIIKENEIVKEFQKTGLNDEEFDALALRAENIEQHCKAMLVLNQVKTAEDRALHMEKVKECLEGK